MVADVTANVAPTARRTRHEGLSIQRQFTKPGVDPFSQIEWTKRRSEIKSPDGKKTIFEMSDVEAPVGWSQTATDIAADKYFRKAGVPSPTGKETSIRMMVDRVAKAVRKSGESQGGYFATKDDAQTFEDELRYLLVNQFGAFNSPVWFNLGLAESYGIAGSACGLWAINLETGKAYERKDTYVHPQVSACFIQSIEDDLMDIADFVKREMRLFKLGSGSGANFSTLRAEGELLSGGGTSSGVMSYLEVFDKAAGAIKSGGTTRRAAKMVVMNVDHPDIEKFVEWKVREEDKVRALIAAGYSSDFNGEAYRTVSGQNANNSVRVTDEFMKAVVEGKDWQTYWRTNKSVAHTFDAKRLFRKMATAAHRCADPGVQFDTTINLWHTVPNSGRINASNPCSEYMSVDDSACNLASLNLMKFVRREVAKDGVVSYMFDVPAYRHAARVFTLAQEILVDHAAYPTERIAQNTHDFRQLGLGYANLGAMLMVMGIPYDSPKGLGIAASLTAILTGTGYATSAEIAASKGPFPGFAHNREPMLNVMRMHRDCALKISRACPDYLSAAAAHVWDTTVEVGEQWGYRNAQATVIAPTGTIGLMMDCDTTGVEPDFALVKAKKLAGGGFLMIPNRSIGAALETLGYHAEAREAILAYVKDHQSVEGAPGLRPEHLAVFDCANKSGSGTRFIEPMAHIKMLEAVQPFVSGSISKTVNCPPETTVEEVESLYMEAWKRGLKCIAIYRDGSKHAQVLSSADTKKETEAKKEAEVKAEAKKSAKAHASEPHADDRAGHAPPETRRHRLRKKRHDGLSQEFMIGSQKVYIRTGEYADGSCGELFIDLHKAGSDLRSTMNCFAVAISLGLQHGVPLRELINAFCHTKIGQPGVVDHPHIKMASSIFDAVVRILAYEYLGEDGLEYVQKKPTDAEFAEHQATRALRRLMNNAKSPAALLATLSGMAANAGLVPAVAAPTALQVVSTNGNGVTGHVVKQSGRTDTQTCTRCGNLTIRSGSCATCSQCGLTTGCS